MRRTDYSCYERYLRAIGEASLQIATECCPWFTRSPLMHDNVSSRRVISRPTASDEGLCSLFVLFPVVVTQSSLALGSSRNLVSLHRSDRHVMIEQPVDLWQGSALEFRNQEEYEDK